MPGQSVEELLQNCLPQENLYSTDPVQAQMQASECSNELHVHCYRNIVWGFQIELVPSASHWLRNISKTSASV